jgi:hypothetical protein
MKARIGFKHQVRAMSGLHSLYDWCYHSIWLYSGARQHSKNDTVMEKHGADALYFTVKSLMHDIWTGDEKAQQDAVH